MWQNFTAKNFRCFSSLLLNPLARVNLIAGKNNTGKTALLEAVQIHSYPENPQLLFDIHSRRGVADGPPYDVELARWLFGDRQQAEHQLELISQDEDGTARMLGILLLDRASAFQRFPQFTITLNQPALAEAKSLLIMRTQENGKEVLAVAVLAQGGITFSGKRDAWHGPSRYLGSTPQPVQNDLEAFSEVEIANRQEEVVAGLRIIEPRLRRLALLLQGGKPVIHGDIGLSRLIPIPLMGEGIRRLLSIVLAIATAPCGRVLVDEIENGFHYSVQKKVWQVIAHAARQADVQIFATTHSYECIQAAHQAFTESGPYDLRVFRLDRVDSEIRVAAYNQTTLETSVDMNLEVR